MSTIAIIGVTGYAGANLAAEALARGHNVVGLSRNPPTEPEPGISFLTGSIADTAITEQLFRQADAVVIATRASGEPRLIDVLDGLLAAAAEHDTRLGVLGGAGSLKVSDDGPRLVDSPDFPEVARAEATAHAEVLDRLRASDSPADWFYVSPGASFGAREPGERTGSYRTQSDVLLADADGRSFISGADLAAAFIDEIEQPSHHRERFTVAY